MFMVDFAILLVNNTPAPRFERIASKGFSDFIPSTILLITLKLNLKPQLCMLFVKRLSLLELSYGLINKKRTS